MWLGLKDNERFLKYCKKENGLLYWKGATNKKGYGIFSINRHCYLAHRVAYSLFIGSKIPEGMCVLHKNDQPSCVDPSVLYLGTYADNAQDRENRSRGNHVKGIYQGSAKLSPRKVKDIRKRNKEGISMAKLGERYGVSSSCINRVIQKETWGWVTS